VANPIAATTAPVRRKNRTALKATGSP
jgi:hypothetical protein